ncbi:desi2 [Symbiodinium natans]|uniref:Desi2 protein n=1 Tax=Symbiodinium natans TaxID=878477 RepID=A0A812T7W3_9DINO|nr:desi2 [Symbiodinium natans]
MPTMQVGAQTVAALPTQVAGTVMPGVQTVPGIQYAGTPTYPYMGQNVPMPTYASTPLASLPTSTWIQPAPASAQMPAFPTTIPTSQYPAPTYPYPVYPGSVPLASAAPHSMPTTVVAHPTGASSSTAPAPQQPVLASSQEAGVEAKVSAAPLVPAPTPTNTPVMHSIGGASSPVMQSMGAASTPVMQSQSPMAQSFVVTGTPTAPMMTSLPAASPAAAAASALPASPLPAAAASSPFGVPASLPATNVSVKTQSKDLRKPGKKPKKGKNKFGFGRFRCEALGLLEEEQASPGLAPILVSGLGAKICLTSLDLASSLEHWLPHLLCEIEAMRWRLSRPLANAEVVAERRRLSRDLEELEDCRRLSVSSWKEVCNRWDDDMFVSQCVVFIGVKFERRFRDPGIDADTSSSGALYFGASRDVRLSMWQTHLSELSAEQKEAEKLRQDTSSLRSKLSSCEAEASDRARRLVETRVQVQDKVRELASTHEQLNKKFIEVAKEREVSDQLRLENGQLIAAMKEAERKFVAVQAEVASLKAELMADKVQLTRVQARNTELEANSDELRARSRELEEELAQESQASSEAAQRLQLQERQIEDLQRQCGQEQAEAQQARQECQRLSKEAEAGQAQMVALTQELEAQRELVLSMEAELVRGQKELCEAVFCRLRELFESYVYTEEGSCAHDVTGTAPVQVVNEVLRPLGTGAFHAAVEVHGREWSYGQTARGPGIFENQPAACGQHSYREAIHMGFTDFSPFEVQMILAEMAKRWRGRDYDVLSKNCCHFSDELCQLLGVGQLPSWVGS